MNDSKMQDEPDVPSSALDLSLTSFYRSGTLSSSASNLVKTADSASSTSAIPSHYHDFISFLAICQTREIDFVGITWDRALDDNSNLIGLGLTSEIRPGTLNLDFTFAFKRLTDSNYAQAAMASGQQRRHRAYEALISEISVLGHPIIRTHENIVRLEGICWDFLPSGSEEKVRPVLMFEKAKYGDLGRFMKSTHGQELSWQQKIRLCSNIVRGLATMHSCGIVHGDIKPHNVLVFQQAGEEHKDQQGDADGYVAKLADFGYSTCTKMKKNTLGGDSVVLPWSPPWNAPEVNADNHTLSSADAKLSDVFSVGVTCLWLLFMDNPPKETADTSNRGYNWLSVLKEERKLKDFVLECLDGCTHLTNPEKNAIKTFFDLTLSPDSCERSTDLYLLLTLLDSNDRTQSHDVPMIPDAEDELSTKESLFELPLNIVQFAATDFRLRQYIITCLQMDALTCGNQTCKENAAFQMAFCYKTGFGCQKDDSAVLDSLKTSGKSTDDLDLTIQFAFCNNQPYKNVQLRRLITEGYIHVIDFANKYRNLGLLKSSEIYYKREIQDLENTFSNENILFHLKTILAGILHSQGKYDEEEPLLRDMAERVDSDTFRALYKGDLDLEGPRTRLAMVYLARGLYEQAMKIFQESLARMENKIGKHHPQSLSTSINFASALQGLGQYDAAESITKECLLQTELILGSDHPSTVLILGNLAALLFKQNHKEKAIEMMEKVARLDERWFGPDHHSTLLSLHNVATMQCSVGKYESMELTTRLVWQKMLNLLGPEHPDTCTSLGTYGVALFRQNKFDAAVVVFRKALDGTRKARGKDHHAILASMNNLAMAHLALKQTEEAGKLMQSILVDRNSRVIRDHGILTNFGLIGQAFAAHGLYDIAEELFRLAVEGEESVLGKSAKQTISHLSILATILLEREKFAEAEAVSRTTLERCGEHIDDEALTLGARNNLAAVLDLQGKYEESIDVYNQSLRTCERLLGPLHHHTLTCVNNLGAALSGQRRYTEAEVFHRRALEGYRDSLGPEHKDTLAVAHNLANTITKQGRFEEAAHLYRETLEMLIKTDHVLVQRCRKNLDLVIGKMAEG